MKILHLIGYLSSEKGGPVSSLKLIAESQSNNDHDVKIAHTSKLFDGNLISLVKEIEIVNLSSFSPLRVPLNFKYKIFKNGYVPDIIHIHGLWYDFVRMGFNWAIKHNIPIIFSPCGMLQEGALSRSKFKKKFVLKLYLKKILNSQILNFHAKSELEKIQIKKLLPNAMINVIANPIDICSESLFQKNQKKNQFVFLGRIHPVKGLDNLIFSWKKIFNENKKWELVNHWSRFG